MSELIVDFLPIECRRRGVLVTSRRRSALLLGLLGTMVVGVALHSWNQFRTADSRRSVSLALTTNATKVDDVIDRLASEQRELHRYLDVYNRLALPIEQSALVATVTHLMPDRVSLSMLRMEVKEDSGNVSATQAANSPSKQTAASETPPAKKAALGSAQWMDVTIRGYAASNGDLYELERKLASTRPFTAVTVSENKPIDVPGSHLQEFTISCKVPLNVEYVKPGLGMTASARTTGGQP